MLKITNKYLNGSVGVATRMLVDTRTWLVQVEAASCKAESYEFATCDCRIMIFIFWHTARVELLKQRQIYGCGSVQAVNVDCCIHMYTKNKGCGSSCTCSQQISLQNVDYKWKSKWHPSLCFHIVLFLILHLMWSNPGQTLIIFDVGLTQMTRTKHDPNDPTRFQHWLLLNKGNYWYHLKRACHQLDYCKYESDPLYFYP